MSLDALVASGLISRDVSLGPYTTYKAGGPARYLAKVRTDEELGVLAAAFQEEADVEVLILGRGSNLVVSDSGFAGLVVKPEGSFAEFQVGEGGVLAGGAVPLPRLARATVDAGYAGLEFFVGVPGTVGGAVRQNAGCFGSETRDWLYHADLFDLRSGGTRRADPDALEMAYRHSNVGSSEVVTRAHFRVIEGDAEASRAELRRITRWRKENQPGGTFNAGSVFKNPSHVAAGELIDELGLKGLAVGDVRVSEKHANFFVAGPDARSSDILELVEVVKARVFEATGTKLETEIQFVGFQ